MINKLIHFSYNKIEKLYDTRDEQDDSSKPVGLWFAKSRDWLEFFSEFEDEIKNCKYMYELKLRYTKLSKPDPEKILRIKKESTFDKFTFKYGRVEKWNQSDTIYYVHIDWKKVVDDYGGIELIPLLESRIDVQDKNILKKYNERFKFTTDDINKKDITLYFWQDSFSIGSGCIWDPDAVKKIKRIYEI